MRRQFKPVRTVMTALMALGVAMSGVAQTNNTISIVVPMYQPKLPDTNSEIFSIVEKATNTKLKIDYVPKPNYLDKLNVLAASNSLPMVTITEAGHIKSNTVVNLAKAGGFWALDPSFSKYPNLKAFYAQYPLAVKNTLIDGKLYGLPRPRPVGRTGIVYRSDWFDALGIKPPATPEEFYNTAKLLSEKDAGKNRKTGTLGYLYADISLGSPGWNGIENLTVALGGPNFWGEADGKLVPDIMTKEYLEALNILRRFYKEKLMNEDFPLASGSKRYDPFNRGIAGMYFGTLNDIYAYHNDLFTIQPQAKLAIAPPMKGPKGIRVNATPGHNGLVLFSKKGIKNEAELDGVLRFFDKLLDPSMLTTLRYGIENVHYKMENGKRSISAEQRKKFQEDIGDFNLIFIEHAIVEREDDSALQKACYAALKTYEKYAVPNPVDPFISPTYVQLGGQLDKLQQDARIQYVMGEIDEAGFQAKVNEWRKRGGDKIIAEYTDLYQKSLKQ